MTPHPVIRDAVASLCSLFAEGGYALTPVIELGTLVVNADGNVDERELEMLRYLYHALLGSQIDPDTVQHLMRSSIEVMGAVGVEARARLIAEILLDCDAVEQGLTVALGVAFASDGLAEAERSIIAAIAHAAGLPVGRLDQLIDEVRTSVGAA
jgi:tellurite resistance protein